MNILQNILLVIILGNLIVAFAMFLLYLQFHIEDKKMKKEMEKMYDEYYGQNQKLNKKGE